MNQVKTLFASPSPRQLNLGLAILRAVVGAAFVAHGAQKLFVYGFASVSAGFAQLGVPFAGVIGPFVGFVELFGGIALILGLLTRVAALGLGSTMVVAILLVHLKNGFFLPNGIEYALSLLGATVMLALTGAGAWSLDAIIAGRDPKVVREPVLTSTRRAA